MRIYSVVRTMSFVLFFALAPIGINTDWYSGLALFNIGIVVEGYFQERGEDFGTWKRDWLVLFLLLMSFSIFIMNLIN